MWTALIVTAALAPQSPAQQQPTGRTPIPQEAETKRKHGGRPLAPGFDQVVREWEENDIREKGLDLPPITPEQYMTALRDSGMAAELASRANSSSARGGGWFSNGPRGGFGVYTRNGRVSDMQIKGPPADPEIWVGAAQGGLWRTTLSTAGVWTEVGANLPNPAVGAFSVHPTESNEIVVATGEAFRQSGAGVFKTTDTGATWTPVQLGAGASPRWFTRMTRDVNDPNLMLLASWDGGLYRSVNGGDTWTRPGTGLQGMGGSFSDILQDLQDPNVFYTTCCGNGFANGVDPGLYRSDDRGATWARITSSAFPNEDDWYRVTIGTTPADPNMLVLRVGGVNGLLGVVRSWDGGQNWDDISGNLAGLSWGGTQAPHTGALAIDPDDPERIYIGGVWFAITEDGGNSWLIENQHPYFVGHADQTEYRFSDLTGDDLLFVCNDGGIYVIDITTDDPQTYDLLGNSQTGLQISEIDFADSDRGFTAIGMQDNGVIKQAVPYGPWNSVETGDGGAIQITDPIAQTFWFAFGIEWRIARHDASGTNHDVDLGVARYPTLHYESDRKLVYSQTDNTIEARVRDGSAPWFTIAADLQPDPYVIATLHSEMGSKAEGGTLYVTYSGDNSRDLTILRRDDSTGVWQIDHREEWAPAGTRPLTVHGSTEWSDVVWIGLAGSPSTPKLMRTTDGGETWTDVSGTLAVNQVHSIATRPFEPDRLYVGSEIGIFTSSNGGETWSPFQEGLPIAICTELRFVPADLAGTSTTLLAATDGRGTWRRSIAMPHIYYVDKDHTGIEEGTRELPFKTVADAVTLAVPGSIIAMKGNGYSEPQRIDKELMLVTWAGPSRVH